MHLTMRYVVLESNPVEISSMNMVLAGPTINCKDTHTQTNHACQANHVNTTRTMISTQHTSLQLAKASTRTISCCAHTRARYCKEAQRSSAA